VKPVLIKRSNRTRLAPPAVPRPRVAEEATPIRSNVVLTSEEDLREQQFAEQDNTPGAEPWAQQVLHSLASQPRPRFSASGKLAEAPRLPRKEETLTLSQAAEALAATAPPQADVPSRALRSEASRDAKPAQQDLRTLEAGHYAAKALARHMDKAKELQKTLKRENRQVYRAYSNIFDQVQPRQAASKPRARRTLHPASKG